MVPQYNQVFRCADEDAIYVYFDSCASFAVTLAATPLAFFRGFSRVVRHGMEYQRAVPVAAGMYYVVIDKTPSARTVVVPASPVSGLGDAAAPVNRTIDAGDAP